MNESIPYHEAGHACCAASIGVGIDSVTIVPAGDIAGQVRFASSVASFDDVEVATVQAAGMVAELLAFGRESGVSQTDTESLVNRTRARMPFGDSGQVEDAAKDLFTAGALKAAEILQANWQAVEHVADLLRTHGTIAAEDVYLAMARYKPKQPELLILLKRRPAKQFSAASQKYINQWGGNTRTFEPDTSPNPSGFPGLRNKAIGPTWGRAIHK